MILSLSTKRVLAVVLVITILANLFPLPFLPSLVVKVAAAIATAGAVVGLWYHTSRRFNRRGLIDPNMFDDAIIVTTSDGRILIRNEAAVETIGPLKLGTNIREGFAEFHKKLVGGENALDVVNAVLAAPSMPFSESLNSVDGTAYERVVRPVKSSRQKLWIIRDVSHSFEAAQEHVMHQTMLADDAARNAELAEQLFHAKQELEIKQAELVRLANTDPLTGLRNRRRFMAIAADMLEEAKYKNGSLWFIMADIDHFKKVNDTHGHAAGDEVIRYVAQIIADQVEGKGVAGRLGGEEFAAVCAGLTQTEARELAEAIRADVEANNTEFGATLIPATISVGVACNFDGETSIEAPLDRADRALYSAKADGRNRTNMADYLAAS